MRALQVYELRKRPARNEKLEWQGFKTHANDVLLWLWINAVSRESNSTTVLTLMWMYVALYSLKRRRHQNCNWKNVRCSTILQYFSKSRSWRHFYHPRSKIIVLHTPNPSDDRICIFACSYFLSLNKLPMQSSLHYSQLSEYIYKHMYFSE